MPRIFIITRKMVWALAMFWFFAITILFVLCLFNGKAHAQSAFSGKDLLNMCISKKVGSQLGCIGIINGVVMGMSYQRAHDLDVLYKIQPLLHNKYGPLLDMFCVPKGVQMVGFESIVKKYLLINLDTLHLSSIDLIIKAIAEAFPCK